MKSLFATTLLALISSVCAIAQNSTGLKFLDEARYRSIPLVSPSLRGELPGSYDLSRFFPVPGNQGKQPSCVGWATAYALKTFQESQEHKWTSDTKDRQFSPAFIYNQIKLKGGGAYFRKAFDVLVEQGAVSLADFPYDETDDRTMPDNAMKQRANPFRIATWRRVNAQDKTELRGHLASHFPILVGVEVGDAFQLHRGSGVFKLPAGQKINGDGHAMTLVGYDDTRSAFRVMNSWGTAWGDKGFVWIDYDAFARMVREAYVVQDVVSPIHDPRPRPKDIDDVPDIPNPQTLITIAQVTLPTIEHNQMHQLFGGHFGMKITPNGVILNGKGRTAQMVTRFTMPDGRMLAANIQERVFRDVTGQVAVGTQSMILNHDRVDISRSSFFIPYYALNMEPTGGRMRYQLFATLSVHVDGFEVARSAPAPFILTW